MKVLILAGGRGTRISEESSIRPKPLVEIGGRPIIWHIMKMYSHYGYNDFVIMLGYRGFMIKDYFASYFLHGSDVQIDFVENKVDYLDVKGVDPWRITLIETGLDTLTGGRIKRAQKYVGDEPFLLTYGDGVSDVDVGALVDFHKAHGRLATLTSVRPAGRFGYLETDGDQVTAFREKSAKDVGRINGGFFVCQPEVFDYIQKGDETIFEREPLEGLAKDGQLQAYPHDGFWQCMDTLRDKVVLNELWDNNEAPWRQWDQ